MRATASEQRVSEPHYTAQKWAQDSGLPYRTILAACKSGELKSHRFTKSTVGPIYISESAFNAWLEKNTTQVLVETTPTRKSVGGSTRPLADYALS